jgi:hypothetical protein
MKKKLLAIASAMAMTLVGVSTVSAATINLAVGDAYYVGVVIDGIPPNNDLEPAYLNSLIEVAPGAIDAAPTGCNYAQTETCNRVGSTLNGLPGVDLTGQSKTDTPNELSGNVLVNGWEYISGKYGNDGIRYWYIGGLLPTDFVTLPQKFLPGTTGNRGGGLSHFTLYNVPGRTVPDGGTTAALLGLSIVGLGMIRRRINL